MTHTKRSGAPRKCAHPPQTRRTAGDVSAAVDDWTRLDRFLVLGTEGTVAVVHGLGGVGAQLGGVIGIERPPSGSEWDGVRDRLSRAAAAFELE